LCKVGEKLEFAKKRRIMADYRQLSAGDSADLMSKTIQASRQIKALLAGL
jgi:hypothetical protein